MSGHDGRVGAGPVTPDRPGPVRTVLMGVPAGIVAGAACARARLASVLLDLGADARDLRIHLVGPSGRRTMSFGPFQEEEVIALWRSLSSASGLVATMRCGDGGIEPLAPQLGPVRLGRVHERRLFGVLRNRRPRFLSRRKPGRFPRSPLVYRKSEIASGTGN